MPLAAQKLPAPVLTAMVAVVLASAFFPLLGLSSYTLSALVVAGATIFASESVFSALHPVLGCLEVSVLFF